MKKLSKSDNALHGTKRAKNCIGNAGTSVACQGSVESGASAAKSHVARCLQWLITLVL